MPRLTRSVLLRWFVVVLSVSVLAACSDDGGNGGEPADGADDTEAPAAADADAYADTVCGALSDWMTSIEEGNTTLQSSLENETDLEQVKQRLLEFLDDTIANTDEMLGTIEDGGAPDVDNGEELHQQLLDLLGQAKTAFEDARDTVDGLDATDPQELGTGLQELGTSLQTAFADVQNPLENAESPELDQAFEENEACTSLDDMAA
jgi:hypothetical protein